MQDSPKWTMFVWVAIAFAGLMWIAYIWERSTGLTFATRRTSGQISSRASLERSRNMAVGATILAAAGGIVYFLLRDPHNE